MAEKITARAKNYPEWYLNVVKEAGLASNSDVRGCMVIKPTGYAVWEKMQRGLDKLFKDTGHVNAYFPLFIPMSYLAKEEEMAEGFAKECAVVTHYRLKAEKGKPLHVDPTAELEEPLIVRPTSETIIWKSYKEWIQSYTDLPLLINQWCNVVRWEMRTRLFLRTAEFLWQEGHTAHATAKEAEEETHRMVNVYRTFAEEFMAMPVLVGPKSDGQKFPGAIYTLCIEAMMQDGKALQAGTSHFLGQNFAKAFDVKFTTQDNKKEFAWATSWGVSTRLIGGLIMTHSDDNGLVIPPRLAPTHVVICPLGRNEAERAPCLAAAEKLAAELRDLPRNEFFGYEPLSVKIDNDMKNAPGYRFAEYELRGVPVRVEIGPKDMEKSACVVARRDVPGKEGKTMGVPTSGAAAHIDTLLRDIQKALFDRAKKMRDSRTVTANTLDEFKQLFPVSGDEEKELGLEDLKFVYAHWDGTRETEDRIQKEFKATIRCIPFDGPAESGTCIFSGQPSTKRVVFAGILSGFIFAASGSEPSEPGSLSLAAKRGFPMRILTGRHLHINSVHFSSDGRFLASDGHRPILGDWFVTVWHVNGDGCPKHTVAGQFKRGDGFTPNSRRLQISQSNQSVALSLATGKVVSGVRPLDSCETSPNRQWIVSHENDFLTDVHRLRAVSLVGRRRVERWTREFPRTPAPTGHDFDGQHENFVRLGFAVNGTQIVVVFKRYGNFPIDVAVQRLRDGLLIEEEIVRVLNTETGQDIVEWRGERLTLLGPNGELIHLRGPTFRILHTSKLDQPAITRTNSSGEHFTAAAFSPDGKLLATTSNDTTVTMWDTTTWQPIRQYGWEIGRLRAVAFAPDGLTCAAGSDTGKVVLFDVDA